MYYSLSMNSLETKEKHFMQKMEKAIMYFLYIIFIGVFALIAWSGSIREGLIMVPIAAITIPMTKWGIKWQNDRYVRSAKNVDDIAILSQKVNELEKQIEELKDK